MRRSSGIEGVPAQLKRSRRIDGDTSSLFSDTLARRRAERRGPGARGLCCAGRRLFLCSADMGDTGSLKIESSSASRLCTSPGRAKASAQNFSSALSVGHPAEFVNRPQQAAELSLVGDRRARPHIRLHQRASEGIGRIGRRAKGWRLRSERRRLWCCACGGRSGACRCCSTRFRRSSTSAAVTSATGWLAIGAASPARAASGRWLPRYWARLRTIETFDILLGDERRSVRAPRVRGAMPVELLLDRGSMPGPGASRVVASRPRVGERNRG